MSEFLSVTTVTENPGSDLGAIGEAMAARFVAAQGYEIVMANFKVPVGRNRKGVQVTGEIDLIALDNDVLCFIEVKTRRSEEFTPILSAVDIRKQRQLTRTAKVYRNIFGICDVEYRYDVVTVLLEPDKRPSIELTRGFWNESKFRKRRWDGMETKENY